MGECLLKNIFDMRKGILFFLFVAAYSTIHAQGLGCKTLVPNVVTLQTVVNNDWLSPPVMTLDGDDVLNIGFDELSHNYHRYIYKVEHCEYDWTVSDGLFESDYLEGFNSNPIEDYQNSLNTTVLYTHYTMQLPNDRCRLKMGGNYLLTIYDEENDNERVAEIRFAVTEQSMNVGMSLTTNTDIDVNRSHQQVSVAVDYGSETVTNIDEQLRLVVTQNGRYDNARRSVKPNIVSGTGLKWEHSRDLIFSAGNEYHKYEILDVSHPTMGIDRMVWDGHNYNAYLFTDELRRNYLTDVDADGSFFIRNSDNVEIDNTCDYVFVHYKLKTGQRYDGTMTIDGHWTTADGDNYVMQYDEADGSYNATLLQKQGYYSYQYLLADEAGRKSVSPSEGNYYQTENRYQAYIYYKETGGRTWRLAGYRQLLME